MTVHFSLQRWKSCVFFSFTRLLSSCHFSFFLFFSLSPTSSDRLFSHPSCDMISVIWQLFSCTFTFIISTRIHYFDPLCTGQSNSVKKDMNYVHSSVSLCVCVELNVWDIGQHRQYGCKEDGHDLYHRRHPTLVPVCVLGLTGKSTHWTVLLHGWLTLCIMCYYVFKLEMSHYMSSKTSTHTLPDLYYQGAFTVVTCHLSAVFFIQPATMFITQLDARHKNRILLTVVVMLLVQ